MGVNMVLGRGGRCSGGRGGGGVQWREGWGLQRGEGKRGKE